MSFSYRRLGPGDALDYRAIRLEALRLHPESFSAVYETQRLVPKLMLETAIEGGSSDRFLTGVYDGSKLIGIFAYVHENEFRLENTGALIQMYLKAEYRGQGLALSLTRFLVEEAKNSFAVKALVLEVNPKNIAARKVYEKAGFRIADRSPLSVPAIYPDLDIMIYQLCERSS